MEKLKRFASNYGYEGWYLLYQHVLENPQDTKARETMDRMMKELNQAFAEAVNNGWKDR